MRLGSLQIEDEISPERFRLWRLREAMERESEAVQVTPVQLQRFVAVELDQFEREFVGSSMEALKVRRMSASDEAEERTKSEKVRERKRVDVVEVAIGGFTERDWIVLLYQSFLCVLSTVIEAFESVAC